VAERMAVTSSDLRRMLDAVDPAQAGEAGRNVPYSVLHQIANLVPCDYITFQVMDPYKRVLAAQDGAECDDLDDPEQWELWWPAFWESCSYPQRSGDFSTVTRGSDHLPGVRKGPKWAASTAAFGQAPMHKVMVCLPPAGTVDRRLLLWRESGSNFSEREVMMLTLLRPHLTALYQRHQTLGGRTPHLTPRQIAVLRLVAMGYTNKQIARELFVAEATVRKHLENIYTRLDVGNRAGALARYRDSLS
jgi:DNA-binding CsgD family transcriptional regulator